MKLFNKKFKSRIVHYHRNYYTFEYSYSIFNSWNRLKTWNTTFQEFSIYIFELDSEKYNEALKIDNMEKVNQFLIYEVKEMDLYLKKTQPFKVKNIV